MPLHTHILTNCPASLFARQAPGGRSAWDNVTFTFGLDLAPDPDVPIVYNRSRWTIRPGLPRTRTAFVGGEPQPVHPYTARFLNQFGLVVVDGDQRVTTKRLMEAPALPWFIGTKFGHTGNPIDYDTIAEWPIPDKDHRVSIITSNRSTLPYHRTRLQLIAHLRETIPDRIVIYGRDSNPIPDKKDGILPHRYHLVLENNGGPWSWSEKLADCFLGWSFPFYVGCENVENDLPTGAFLRINPNDHEGTAQRILSAIEADLWHKRRKAITEARLLILHHYNTLAQFARITRSLASTSKVGPPCILRSEKSLPPEPGSRGSMPEMLLRRMVLALDPGLELRIDRNRLKQQERG